MKKIAGVILAICVLCTGMAYADGYGIIDSTADVNETMTRAEMTKSIVIMHDLQKSGEDAKGAVPFEDVSPDDPLSGYIHLAKQMGAVEGHGDGTFNPGEPVTFEQAVKMILCVLGYKVRAEATGGYPIGYVMVASQLGLTKGISAISGEPARVGDIKKLVNNALTTPVMVQTAFSANQENHEFQVLNGENGVAFVTMETRYLNLSSFYLTDKNNNIILTDRDLSAVSKVPNSDDNFSALELTLTDEGRVKLANATEEIAKAAGEENYVKVIVGEIIAKPTVTSKIDSEKFIVQGQFGETIVKSIAEGIQTHNAE